MLHLEISLTNGNQSGQKVRGAVTRRHIGVHAPGGGDVEARGEDVGEWLGNDHVRVQKHKVVD